MFFFIMLIETLLICSDYNFSCTRWNVICWRSFSPGMRTSTYISGTLTADWPIDLKNSLQLLMLELPFVLYVLYYMKVVFSYNFGLQFHDMLPVKIHKPKYSFRYHFPSFDSDPANESTLSLIAAFIREHSWFLLSALVHPSICV